MIYKLKNGYFIEDEKNNGYLIKEKQDSKKNNEIIFSSAENIDFIIHKTKISKEEKSTAEEINKLTENELYLIESFYIKILHNIIRIESLKLRRYIKNMIIENNNDLDEKYNIYINDNNKHILSIKTKNNIIIGYMVDDKSWYLEQKEIYSVNNYKEINSENISLDYRIYFNKLKKEKLYFENIVINELEIKYEINGKLLWIKEPNYFINLNNVFSIEEKSTNELLIIFKEDEKREKTIIVSDKLKNEIFSLLLERKEIY